MVFLRSVFFFYCSISPPGYCGPVPAMLIPYAYLPLLAYTPMFCDLKLTSYLINRSYLVSNSPLLVAKFWTSPRGKRSLQVHGGTNRVAPQPGVFRSEISAREDFFLPRPLIHSHSSLGNPLFVFLRFVSCRRALT